MFPASPPRFLALPLLAFLLWCLSVTPARSAAEPVSMDKRRLKAEEFEKRGAWLEACRAYDDILRKDRNSTFARLGYQRCLRRLHLAVRQNDPDYRQTLARLTQHEALDAYEQVLALVRRHYPDSSRSGITHLFQQGLQELRYALEDETFRRNYLPHLKTADLKALKNRINALPTKRLNTTADARDQVLSVVRMAPREAFNAIIMEFAAGASNALDEYSAFLSNGNLALIQSALRGELASVGIDVGLDDDEQMTITRVHAKSPAEEAGLLPGDYLLRIDRIEVKDLPVEAVAERLLGRVGTRVELEIARPGLMGKRGMELLRRLVPIPTVEYDIFRLDDGTPAGASVGYLRILHFQESTPQDVKEAFNALSAMDAPKGIILDLRGNPGGVFTSAVAVAELFVSGGIIVIGRSTDKEYNKPFKADTGGPLQMPLVVLIDGDTASAAEVLAGALREGRPTATTKLIGQTTFGKGSIQSVLPMEKGPLNHVTGLRLTVAKLFSPSNQPYTGRGVAPHEVSELKGEELIAEARKQMLELLKAAMTARMLTMRNPM